MRYLQIFVAILSGALLVPLPAHAQSPSCHIGKPSYCFKYGGEICEKVNARGKDACPTWTKACIDCHTAISECFGHKRPLADSAQCSRCSAAWSACMKRIEKRYWPNRMSG